MRGGGAITQTQREVGVSRPTIYKCVDKALAAGVRTGLRDRYHRPREPEILPDAKAWVVSVACQQPKALGLAAELWTLSALTAHVQCEAEAAGFPRLSRISRSSVWRILQEQGLKPHRVRYYLERRDPEFDRKMREVLMVYRDVFLTPPRADATPTTYTVSVDEKPGVQAIGTTAPDLPPVAGQQAMLSRNHEYVRHGTLSILAALLECLHRHYPPDAVIRVVLDNHSAHISRETMAYLATRPGCFEYVHTPKHGSWLNLIECAFSKMARTFLRHIRVASAAELKSRILKGIAEMNENPVQLRWRNFDLGIS